MSVSVHYLSVFVRVLSVRVRPCFVCQCVWCVCVFLSSHLIMPQANLMELNKEENADHYVMSREEKIMDWTVNSTTTLRRAAAWWKRNSYS
uniref:Secreted protein n=1 Tax=Meloidogyne incognita TaxID=6306 RepID=A0A914LDS7_MELIC